MLVPSLNNRIICKHRNEPVDYIVFRVWDEKVAYIVFNIQVAWVDGERIYVAGDKLWVARIARDGETVKAWL
jgi:hypothetical protein